jgi:hypothetical protein
MAGTPVETFLRLKAVSLWARARQIIRLTPEAVGLRARDLHYATSPAHFSAAPARPAAIDQPIAKVCSRGAAARAHV